MTFVPWVRQCALGIMNPPNMSKKPSFGFEIYVTGEAMIVRIRREVSFAYMSSHVIQMLDLFTT